MKLQGTAGDFKETNRMPSEFFLTFESAAKYTSTKANMLLTVVLKTLLPKYQEK